MREGVERRKLSVYPQNTGRLQDRVTRRRRSVQVWAPLSVLRLLGNSHDSEEAALVHWVQEHSLLPTESFVTCGHLSTSPAPAWQPLLY